MSSGQIMEDCKSKIGSKRQTSKRKNFKKQAGRNGFVVAAILGLISACAGPDNRVFDGEWEIVENQCDDVSVEVRTRKVERLNGTRKVTFFDVEKRKIFSFTVNASRAGAEYNRSRYKNTAANTLIDTKKM